MTSENRLPKAEADVEITTDDGRVRAVQVQEVKGRAVTLIGATVPATPPGTPVTLRWAAAPRGRYAQPATVVAAAPGRLVVTADGDPTIEQLRQFVRGGGGERVWLRMFPSAKALELEGVVADLSECSFRGRFERLQLAAGDQVWARLDIEGETVDLGCDILTTRSVPGTHDSEVVVLFDCPEAVARVIRKYLLRMQLRARQSAG